MERIDWRMWLEAGGFLIAAVVLALIAHFIIVRILMRVTARTEGLLDDSVLKRWRGPTRLLLPAMAVQLVTPLVDLPPGTLTVLGRSVAIVIIIAVSWMLIASTYILDDYVENRWDITAADNLEARQIHTRVQIFRKVTVILVTILGIAAALMVFPRARQLGVGIFASAGLAGIVVGMAARPTLSALIAGVQVALAQPIRLDDVVIVEGEWGRVEEITSTFVVIRIWDLRRLVVPLNYFIEQPFQNWTRVTADLLGTVILHCDYTVPVDMVRAELKRILDESPKWDGNVWGLQVTDSTDRTMTLRALVSAANSGDAWELRCEVREKLIAYLQREHPGCLPRSRADVAGAVRAAIDSTPPSSPGAAGAEQGD